MPGTRCAIATCINSLVKTRRENLDISYHRFPKNDVLKDMWIMACQRTDLWNADTSVVCSIHFTEHDFQTDLKNSKTKRRLKSTAVPSLFVLKDKSQNGCSEATNEFITLISMESEVDDPNASNSSLLTMEDESLKKLERVYLGESFEDELPNLCSLEDQLEDLSELDSPKYKMLLEEKETLQMKYNELRDSFNKQKQKMGQLKRALFHTSKKFRKECIDKRKLQIAMNSIFSKAQQDVIINKRKKILWKSEDMSKAYTLRCLSKSCYIYIRNTLKYPLPHIETLAKWTEKLKRKELIPLEDLNDEFEDDYLEKNIIELFEGNIY